MSKSIPPVPENELDRLRALKSYRVLDTLPEEDFDAITKLAAHICGTPIALISLLDENRQWFKSKIGIDVPETARSISFCQHAIMEENVFEVEDASTNEKFSDNPLVTDGPEIRFYAGAPLIGPKDLKLGTLCVIDSVPKGLTDEQREALELLAQQVVSQLEIRKQKADLEQVNEQLSKFAYVVSHDLKSPLRAVANLTSFIEADAGENLDTQSQEHLQLIKNRVQRMEALIEGILSYSQITGNAQQEPLELETREEVEEVLAALQIPAGFSVKLSGEFPNLKINRWRFQQLIQNLVSNALKYHDKSEGRIEISVEEQGSCYLFTVRDDGPGIAPEYQQKIFDLFQTLQTKDNCDSTGIGLALVKRIVEEEGGELSLESAPGDGSCFSFSLHKTS